MNTNTQVGMTIRFRHVKYCPITGNQPVTTMTSIEAAERICARHRLTRQQGWCSTCRGKHLTEYVKIVPLETLAAKEEIMAKDRFMKCDCCGAEKTCRKVHDSDLCMSCQSIYAAAKNRPQTVISALGRFGHLPAVPEGGQGEKSDSEVILALEKENDRLRELKADLDATAEYLRNELAANKGLLDDREREIAKLGKVIDDMESEVARLNKNIDEMGRQIIAGKDIIGQQQKMLVASAAEVNRLRAVEDAYLNDRPADGVKTSGTGRDAALLDIAIDIIAGKISGITHEQFRALREVA